MAQLTNELIPEGSVMKTKIQKPNEIYGADFYQAQVEGSLQSANIIIPQLLRISQDIGSVIDIGCGTGAWLSVFTNNGVLEILGIDGGDIPQTNFLINQDQFIQHSLTERIDLDATFDLAMSLEVAEHLEENYAEDFVRLLCSLSDLVLFGAAIPGQGGHNHVNERWPSYWVALFKGQGYIAHDPIRPLIWSDNRIEWWYRQNTLLFVNAERADHLKNYSKYLVDDESIVDLVHPECFLTFRNTLERYTNPSVYEQEDLREWAMLRVNEEHRIMCEEWLDLIIDRDIKNIALFCAGGNAGLGPYLISRCGELEIDICAYFDHFHDKPLSNQFTVQRFDVHELSSISHIPEAFLIASPGFASEIIGNIKRELGDDHPPLLGFLP